MTPAERAAVVAEALSWERTPYRDHATLKGQGTDCAMYGLMVYRATLPGFPQSADIPKYVRQQFLHRDGEPFVETILKLGAVEVDTPGNGDFAVWKFGRSFSHGAVVLAWPRIIHAVVGTGVIRADASANARLHQRPVRFFTWPTPEA